MREISNVCLMEMSGKVKGAVIEGVWRGADIYVNVWWVGISLFYIEFGFHFKTP